MGELVIHKIKHFVKNAKKSWRKLKYLDKTQLNYYIITGFIAAFCVFTGSTYAALTYTTYVTVGNITTAKLSYNLAIDSCTYGTNYASNCTYDNNTGDAFPTVTVPANTTVYVDMTITSRNNNYTNYTSRGFNTKYAIDYSKVNTGITTFSGSDNVLVYYSQNNPYNMDGLIGPYGSSITPIRAVIVNNNDSNQTVYFTAVGGYTQNTLYSNISTGFYEKDLTLRTIVLDSDFSVISTSLSASFPENTASASYAYMRSVCTEDEATVTWDNDEWELNVDSESPVSCDVYFKKMCNGSNICSDVEIVYFVREADGSESVSNTSPDNTYTYTGYTCNNNATLSSPTWNSTTSTWDFNISGINGTTLCTAYFEVDTSGANAPKLVNNLIPVVYDEDTSKWVMSDNQPGSWYNYSKLKWANAVTVKENKRGTYDVGDTIEMDDILGMWVWIPRYEYKYTNLGTTYAGGTESLPGQIDIKFIKGTSTTEDTGYIIHPAFRDGSVTYTNNAYTTTSAYQMGGWDSEITGFWMGKFETSSLASSTGETSAVLSDPIVKPNVIARRYQKVSDQYNTILNVKTFHGISTMDSHMSKNSEWGAVTYLSQSIYGKRSNTDYSGSNKEIYINNSSSFYTGRSMGAPANTNGSSSSAGTYQYNAGLNGTGASTTGTIYGIYDMSGGTWEYQMGWLFIDNTTWGAASSSNNAGFTLAPSNHRYYEEYTTTAATTACGGITCYGHALSETGGWYGDHQNMVSTTSPWFARGAGYNSSASTGGGLFRFYKASGNADPSGGVRAVLV